MATYYIYRKDVKGTLSAQLLGHYAKAFRTLYCGVGVRGNPKLQIIVRGTWENYDKDGLYLQYNQGAEIVKIGRKYITVEFKGENGKERATLELTPANESGFSEIMFIEIYGKEG